MRDFNEEAVSISRKAVAGLYRLLAYVVCRGTVSVVVEIVYPPGYMFFTFPRIMFDSV